MFIGRKQEIEEMLSILKGERRTFTVFLGQRGVGKTAFLDELKRIMLKVEECKVLFFKGDLNTSDKILCQSFLNHFCYQFEVALPSLTKLNWFFVFKFIKETLSKTSQKVVFLIDEFSWFQKKQGDFLFNFIQFFEELGQFNIHFVVTGSAIAWLSKNLSLNKGNLFQRVRTVVLKPFSLLETSEYLYRKNALMTIKDIVDYAIFTGGVPRFLEKIDVFQTKQTNLERLFSQVNDLSGNELESLFAYMFMNKSQNLHYQAMALFKNRLSINSDMVAKELKISTPTAIKILKELTLANLIVAVEGHKGKSPTIYRIVDLYCFFGFRFLSKKEQINADKVNVSMMGLAFEILCYNNVNLIKRWILKDFKSKNYAWQNKNSQVDLVIDYEQLNFFKLVECKYYSEVFLLSEDYEKELNQKQFEFFKHLHKPKQKKANVSLLLVSLYGVKRQGNMPLEQEQIVIEQEVKKHLALLP